VKRLYVPVPNEPILHGLIGDIMRLRNKEINKAQKREKEQFKVKVKALKSTTPAVPAAPRARTRKVAAPAS